MSTQDEISQIIKERYGDYKGKAFWELKVVHNELRALITDEEFLLYLRMAELNNPKPVYKLPDSIKLL